MNRMFYVGIFLLFSLSAEELILSDKDIEAVQPLFDHLFKFEQLSYTLFSKKPMSFVQIAKVPQYPEITHLISLESSIYRILAGWAHWKSLVQEREYNHYRIIEKSTEQYQTIILINKAEFRRVFEEHQELFRNILGEAMTADLLLAEIAADHQSLRQALKHDDRLLGLLLGYGERNSEAFFERIKFWSASRTILNEDLWPKNRFQGSYKHFTWLYLIQPVQFVGLRHDPESSHLLNIYRDASSQIAKKFRSENFVKVVVRELCKE